MKSQTLINTDMSSPTVYWLHLALHAPEAIHDLCIGRKLQVGLRFSPQSLLFWFFIALSFSVSARYVCSPASPQLRRCGSVYCFFTRRRSSCFTFIVWGERRVEKRSHLVALGSVSVCPRRFTPWEELGLICLLTQLAFSANTLL